jgi:hypothetical protein
MADPGYVDLPATGHFTFEYNQSWNPGMATSIGNSLRDTAEKRCLGVFRAATVSAKK